MAVRSIIGFETDPPEDIVNFAVAPIDALTGRIVDRNITASITVEKEARESGILKLPDKPIRNLSGLLVFVNLPEHPLYHVHVQARDAGYFDPDPKDFPPSDRQETSDPGDRFRLDFPLIPRPGFPFSDEVTLISGAVVRSDDGVAGARISAIVPGSTAGVDQTFETRSDERGAFALAVRLPDLSANGDSENNEAVDFMIETKGDNGGWRLELELTGLKIFEGQSRAFKQAIDLANPGNPVLVTI